MVLHQKKKTLLENYEKTDDVIPLFRINSRAEELLREERLVQMLSIGQIRPEKDHRLQICFLAELKKRLLKENLNCKVGFL